LDRLQIHSTDTLTFHEANTALFQILHEKTGAKVFIDSSKKLKRLRLLLDDPSFEVLPIHLVRRPEGVINSGVRRNRDWLQETRNYHANLFRRYDFLRHRPHVLVAYEALCRQPAHLLDVVLQKVGLHFDAVQLEWATQEHHNVNGNRGTRTSRDSTIRLDESWRRALSAQQRLRIRWEHLKFRNKLLFQIGLWPQPIS
jgi:hypothetical protein